MEATLTDVERTNNLSDDAAKKRKDEATQRVRLFLRTMVAHIHVARGIHVKWKRSNAFLKVGAKTVSEYRQRLRQPKEIADVRRRFSWRHASYSMIHRELNRDGLVMSTPPLLTRLEDPGSASVVRCFG